MSLQIGYNLTTLRSTEELHYNCIRDYVTHKYCT